MAFSPDQRVTDDRHVRRRQGGDGLKYTVPMSMMPKLGQINSTIQDPLGRYNAVMAIADLYSVEPVK